MLKCKAPARDVPGFVNLELLCDGQIVGSLATGTARFEYRVAPKASNRTTVKRFKVQDDEDFKNIEREREFKVRIIDRLSMLDQSLHASGYSSGQGGQLDCDELHKLRQLEISMLDTMEQEFMLKVLSSILKKLEERNSRDTVKKMLDMLDEHGYALVHYFSYIG